MPTTSAESQTQYAALRGSAGIGMLKDRTQVALTGKDRAAFLHAFCTNDIKRLEPGQGCEAFLTDVQGKTIGFINVFCEADQLVIESAGGQAGHIIASLDRYLIREDVTFVDLTEQSSELLVAGPLAAKLIEQVTGTRLDLGPHDHQGCIWLEHHVTVRRFDFAGQPDFAIAIETAASESLQETFVAAGAIECEASVIECARIEAGTPVFGVDVSSDNLPQEVDRNGTAISFTKGCYLGQETVARIDALGHVNRLLRGIQVGGETVPAPGEEFLHDGKVAARATSSCWSHKLQAPLVMAYVRRQVSTPGTQLESPGGGGVVVALPLAGKDA